jgi:hypothetical protein
MSDNESEVVVSENESEGPVDDAKDYESRSENESGAESEAESGDEKTKPKKKPELKPKVKSEDDEDDDVEEINAEEEEEEEYELDPQLVEKASNISQKAGIIIDPRQLDSIAKPGSKIKREIIVSREKHKSNEYLQLFEFCELIGIRSEHLSQGADAYVEIESETTARDIAKKELQMGRCPFLIKRYMTPTNFDPTYVEIWNPNEMAIDSKFFDT